MKTIIGRDKEIQELNDLFLSNKAQLVAVYGRRRVGKTFLVDEALKGLITFRHAGLSPVDEDGNANMLSVSQQKLTARDFFEKNLRCLLDFISRSLL